ncbi:MAG: NADH-ubiquinone oxidoreductase-F iron-sulfur binding region domain-containing protein, partial [Acidimicrobiia bacterium]
VPTVVGNVETLAHVALIARHGADWFREGGSAGLPGTILVTLPAQCATPGVYEVPGGAWFDEVLATHGGGVPAGVRGAQVGGPAAGWIAEDFHVALEPAALRDRNSMLGCAAVRLLTEDACAVDAVAEAAAFFARESCGKCPPCRMETQLFATVTGGLRSGRGITRAQLDKALQVAEMVSGTTDCALTRFPAPPLRSALELFTADFTAHLEGRDCGRSHSGGALAVGDGITPGHPAR